MDPEDPLKHPKEPLKEHTEKKRSPIFPETLLQESLKKAQSEIKELKDKYLRTLSEMENSRKRLQQEKQEAINHAIDHMLIDFLSPLDNLENALSYTDHLSPELKNWAQGFKMIADQFKEVLKQHNIKPYSSVGQPFDPYFHECIETIETDKHKQESVVSEITKGYKRGDKILRVAKVKVAKSLQTKETNQEDTEGEIHDKKEKK